MSREGEAPTSKDLVAAAREQMASEGGASGAMVEAARRRFSEVPSRERKTSVSVDLGSATVVRERTTRAPVKETRGYPEEVHASASSARRPAPQPVPAPPSEVARTTGRRVRRLVAFAVAGFVVFTVLNSNYEGIRDFVEEQLDGSATSDRPQVEETEGAPEEVQGTSVPDYLGEPTELASGRRVFASDGDQSVRKAVDGNPHTLWNAEDWPPQWIVIDLGTRSTIGSVRLLTSQLPAGTTTHQIVKWEPDGEHRVLHVFNEETFDAQQLTFRPDPPIVGVRYLAIETVSSPSWVAWREIEINEHSN